MTPLNQVNIEETSTMYDVKLKYHSDKKDCDYTVMIEAKEEADGSVSLDPMPCGAGFEFVHSDPDRVIAIAQMMLSFAQMVKNNNKKVIDATTNE